MFQWWQLCQRYTCSLLIAGLTFVLALRVLREAEMEYGFKDGLYLNTALMIVEQMNGLIGD